MVCDVEDLRPKEQSAKKAKSVVDPHCVLMGKAQDQRPSRNHSTSQAESLTRARKAVAASSKSAEWYEDDTPKKLCANILNFLHLAPLCRAAADDLRLDGIEVGELVEGLDGRAVQCADGERLQVEQVRVGRVLLGQDQVGKRYRQYLLTITQRGA